MLSHSLKWVAVLCATVALAAGVRYVTRHRLPIGYDEAVYINQVIRDRDVLVNDGVLAFARKQLGTETWRPPGYRIVAAPVALATGGDPSALRLLALVSLVITGLLLFGAGREIAGPAAGVTWALAGGLAVSTFEADIWFGTEVPLYPAIAAALFGTARVFVRGRADRVTLALLFVAVGLGGLAKLSFFVIFAPMIAVAWWLAAGSRMKIGLSVTAGVLVMAPWWAFNWRDAFDYAKYASGFVRHGFPWFSSAAIDLLGIPLTIGLFVATAWSLVRYRSINQPGPARDMIVTCLAAAIPLTFLHAAGSNHNMRLLSPAWLPAAGILALALHRTGALASRAGQGIAALGFAVQAGLLARDTWRETAPQRDWSPLREMLRDIPAEEVRVAHLGETEVLNAPQILYAWRRHGETIDPDRLWRWENGPLDWSELQARVDSAVLVLVPLGPTPDAGEEKSDNVHNAELVACLEALPEKWTPDTLPATAGDRTRYVVFRKR